MIRILFNEGDDNQLEERESDIKLSIMLTQLYNSIRIIKLGLYDDGNGKQSRDELIICMGNVRINEVKAKFYPLNKFDAYNKSLLILRYGDVFSAKIFASEFMEKSRATIDDTNLLEAITLMKALMKDRSSDEILSIIENIIDHHRFDKRFMDYNNFRIDNFLNYVTGIIDTNETADKLINFKKNIVSIIRKKIKNNKTKFTEIHAFKIRSKNTKSYDTIKTPWRYIPMLASKKYTTSLLDDKHITKDWRALMIAAVSGNMSYIFHEDNYVSKFKGKLYNLPEGIKLLKNDNINSNIKFKMIKFLDFKLHIVIEKIENFDDLKKILLYIKPSKKYIFELLANTKSNIFMDHILLKFGRNLLSEINKKTENNDKKNSIDYLVNEPDVYNKLRLYAGIKDTENVIVLMKQIYSMIAPVKNKNKK